MCVLVPLLFPGLPSCETALQPQKAFQNTLAPPSPSWPEHPYALLCVLLPGICFCVCALGSSKNLEGFLLAAPHQPGGVSGVPVPAEDGRTD